MTQSTEMAVVVNLKNGKQAVVYQYKFVAKNLGPVEARRYCDEYNRQLGW